MKKSVGMNGFGRFGLHLLKYWLDRRDNSSFSLDYINDDSLDIDKVINIIKKDKYVKFSKYKIKNLDNSISITDAEGLTSIIEFTKLDSEKIDWLGKPDIFFECTGKNTIKKDSKIFVKNNTKLVIISATSWDPDQTLVYGFNHLDFNKDNEIISYGSCTVNAYVPFHNYLSKKYKLINADVNVIHNIQEYKLSSFDTLVRKFCTLEKSATLLLEDVNDHNFNVNYTVIPYAGVSMIDFRFQLQKNQNLNEIKDYLQKGFNDGELSGLYNFVDKDIGPEVHKSTIYSSVFIKDNIKLVGDQLYLQAYFDNENSVNRFYDLSNFISNKI